MLTSFFAEFQIFSSGANSPARSLFGVEKLLGDLRLLRPALIGLQVLDTLLLRPRDLPLDPLRHPGVLCAKRIIHLAPVGVVLYPPNLFKNVAGS